VRASISFIFADQEQWDAINHFYEHVLGLQLASSQVVVMAKPRDVDQNLPLIL